MIFYVHIIHQLFVYPFFLQSRTVEASRNSRSMENLDYEPGGRKSSKNPEKQSRKRDSNKDEEQQRKNKKENRKSTPSAMPSSGGGGISSSHGSPSRAAEKSSSGNGNQKRRDPQPSGVGAVGGRGSILHNTVNPLLTEVRVLSCCVLVLVFYFVSDFILLKFFLIVFAAESKV